MLRMRHRSPLASAKAAGTFLLASLVVAPTLRAQQPAETSDLTSVAALADDQTLAVVEVDLDALDVDAAGKWLAEAAGKSGQPQQAVAEARQQIDQGSKIATKAIADLRAAKAHRLYWIFSLTDPGATGGAGPGLMVVPLGAGADAGAIANVLKSGSAQGGPAGGNGAPTTATVGNVVVAGSSARVEQAKQKAPAAGAVDRAAVTEALAAGGMAPVRVALVASGDLRKVLEQQAPDLPAKAGGGRTEVLTRGVKWASVAVTPPPKGAFRVAVHTADADSAARVNEQITALLRVVREDRNARAAVGAEMIEDAVKRLTPHVEGNDVTVLLDQQAIDRFVPALALGLRQQREKAGAMVAMNNMRQILLGCVMYANDHKEILPPEEKWNEIVLKEQDMSASVFTNPRLPGKTPGFIYVRPPAGLKTPDPSHIVVLYEPTEVEGPMIGVGFLDGHVELMTRADFDKRVKPQLQHAVGAVK
jgi:hypothetical protein